MRERQATSHSRQSLIFVWALGVVVLATVGAPRTAASAVVFPSLDLRAGDQGSHADIGVGVNFEVAGLYYVLDLRLKLPFIGDDRPDTNFGGGLGSLKVLNGSVFVGLPFGRRTRKVAGGTVRKTGESKRLVGLVSDPDKPGKLAWKSKVSSTYRRRHFRNLDQDEFWTVEAGAISSTVGYGPSFGRIIHPAVGVRWVESTHRSTYQRFWSAAIHILGPGIQVPSGFRVTPALPDTIPVGIMGLYDLGVGPYFTLGLKAGVMPGYEMFGSVDLKIPLYF